MRGGALPPALLFAALAFALAFAPRGRVVAVAVALVVAAAVALMPVPPAAIEPIFAGCWASVAVTALLVHLRDGPGPMLAAALGVNAGAWSGAVVAIAGKPADLAVAAAALALVVPAAWLVGGRRGIAVKVAASWLVAIALLAAVLPLVPTPGYTPDHMD